MRALELPFLPAFVAVFLASITLLVIEGETSDYSHDAGPSIAALVHGDLEAFLERPPLMGIVSILLRAPLAALAGGAERQEYLAGAVPCLLIALLVAWHLAGRLAERGTAPLVAYGAATIAVLNPITASALRFGHPEELLGGALLVAAVLVAQRGRPWTAGVVLGLAIATKQWALLGTLPVALAAPGRRHVVLGSAALVGAALYLPWTIASFGSFVEMNRTAGSTEPYLRALSVWFPFTDPELAVLPANSQLDPMQRPVSPLVVTLAKPLILALAAAIPLLAARHLRPFTGLGRHAFGLLALVLLIRCALDPADAPYYHVPFLLALFAWAAAGARATLPCFLFAAAALSVLLARHSQAIQPTNPELTNAIYLAIVGITAIWIGAAVRPALRRSSDQRALALALRHAGR